MPPSNGDNKGGMVAYGGFYGGWSFSSAMKNPEKAIKMLDFLYSPEGQKLRVYGLEGVHHTVKDGKYEFIAEEDFNKYSDISNYKQLFESREAVFYEAYGSKRTDILNN